MKQLLIGLTALMMIVTGQSSLTSSSYALKPLEGTNDPRQLVVDPSPSVIRVSPDPTPSEKRQEPLAREKRVYSSGSDERDANRAKGLQICQERWSVEECQTLDTLIGGKESGWNANAQNPYSTAYGIFQFLDSTWAGVGCVKSSDPEIQIRCGLTYIENRYQTPSQALHFWLYEAPKINGQHWY